MIELSLLLMGLAWWRCCCGPKCAACTGTTIANLEWDITLANLTESPGTCINDENCVSLEGTYTVTFDESRFTNDVECMWSLDFTQVDYCGHLFGIFAADRIELRIHYRSGSDDTRILVLLRLNANISNKWDETGGVIWETVVSGKVNCTDTWALTEADVLGTPDSGCLWRTNSDVSIARV